MSRARSSDSGTLLGIGALSNFHDMKTNDKKQLTSENGRPIADNQNTQTAGYRGPVTLQDTWLLEKMAHFDREVIPERRMHAKGAGAFGTFTVTHDITKYTRASIFSEVGKKTQCFVRFSTDRKSVV